MSGFILNRIGKRGPGYYCKDCNESTPVEKPCGLGHLPFSMWEKYDDGSAYCPRCGDTITAPNPHWVTMIIREGKNIFTGK